MNKLGEFLYRSCIVLVLGALAFAALLYLADNHFLDGPFLVLIFATGVPLLYFPLHWVAHPLRETYAEKAHLPFVRTKIMGIGFLVLTMVSVGFYSFNYFRPNPDPIATAADQNFSFSDCLRTASEKDENSQRTVREDCLEKAQQAGNPVHTH